MVMSAGIFTLVIMTARPCISERSMMRLCCSSRLRMLLPMACKTESNAKHIENQVFELDVFRRLSGQFCMLCSPLVLWVGEKERLGISGGLIEVVVLEDSP